MLVLVGRSILEKVWPGLDEIWWENLGPPSTDDPINGGDHF